MCASPAGGGGGASAEVDVVVVVVVVELVPVGVMGSGPCAGSSTVSMM